MTITSFSLTEAPIPISPPKIGLNPKGQDLSGKLRRYRSRGSSKDQNIEPPVKDQLSFNIVKQIFTILNPSIQSLEQAARESSKYKETLAYLNSLDKNLIVNVDIGLSYRNLDRSLKTIADQSSKDIISVFFKDLTSKIRFIFSKDKNDAMFATISLNFPISHIPDIMSILPIFYKIELSIENVKHTVYGISKLEKSYEIVQNMYRTKKSNDDLESEKDASFSDGKDDALNAAQSHVNVIDQSIKSENDRVDQMPFDQQYEFIHLDNKSPDFTGPFLLKWT